MIHYSVFNKQHNSIPLLYAGIDYQNRRMNQLASFILLPFSNRIKSGFSFNGRDFTMPANMPGQANVLHGDAFYRNWQTESISDDSITLTLNNGDCKPFVYSAEQQYTLGENTLLHELSVTNLADTALPYGAGFHPHFPRDQSTRLQFSATDYWQTDNEGIPHSLIPLMESPEYDFNQLKSLPDIPIDHAFKNWNGTAIIEQKDLQIKITASQNLGTALVFSPSADSPFFCFEPVSHPVNAHNMSGLPGLTVLEKGETLSCWMKFEWQVK